MFVVRNTAKNLNYDETLKKIETLNGRLVNYAYFAYNLDTNNVE